MRTHPQGLAKTIMHHKQPLIRARLGSSASLVQAFNTVTCMETVLNAHPNTSVIRNWDKADDTVMIRELETKGPFPRQFPDVFKKHINQALLKTLIKQYAWFTRDDTGEVDSVTMFVKVKPQVAGGHFIKIRYVFLFFFDCDTKNVQVDVWANIDVILPPPMKQLAQQSVGDACKEELEGYIQSMTKALQEYIE